MTKKEAILAARITGAQIRDAGRYITDGAKDLSKSEDWIAAAKRLGYQHALAAAKAGWIERHKGLI